MKRQPGSSFARLTIVSLLIGLSVSAQSGRDPGAGLDVAAVVQPLFDLRSPERSPFPSDAFTVADTNQNTGRRVNLPMPSDCRTFASECEDVSVLNQLDGFNMVARIAVPFDGDIDPASVTSKTIFLVKLRDVRHGRDHENHVIGINYIVWDPATRELSFRPDNHLDQHTRYALAVTTGVRDQYGQPVGVAPAFREALKSPASDGGADYRQGLMAAAERVRPVIPRGVEVAALSVFTTQTFSHIVERMREAIQRAPAPTLNFNIGPTGERAVFADSTIAAITNNADINVGGALTPQNINLAQWRAIIPGTVGTVAFGTFRTFDFSAGLSGHVPLIATRTGRLVATGEIDVAFNLWLPAGTSPRGGWPVYIYAHGSFGDKNSGSRVASIAASHGLATITINALGRGLGPRTTMTVRRTDGSTMTFPAPGLGRDQDGNNVIGDWEPFRASRPNHLHNLAGPSAVTISQGLPITRDYKERWRFAGNPAVR